MEEPPDKATCQNTGTLSGVVKRSHVYICPEYDELDVESGEPYLPKDTPIDYSLDVVYCPSGSILDQIIQKKEAEALHSLNMDMVESEEELSEKDKTPKPFKPNVPEVHCFIQSKTVMKHIFGVRRKEDLCKSKRYREYIIMLVYLAGIIRRFVLVVLFITDEYSREDSLYTMHRNEFARQMRCEACVQNRDNGFEPDLNKL
jgi:hypothetical protein